MTTLRQRLASLLFFSDVEEALSAERARNEAARAKLSATRLKYNGEERELEAQVNRLDGEIKAKRETYARKAKPMLVEFDDIAISQHYYQEVSNSITAQEGVLDEMSQRELGEFGYISKKLISVSINFEALKQQLLSGKPFSDELRAALEDAESDDLFTMAAPLASFADSGIPRSPAVRAMAFDLARAIEETGKAPVQEPVRGWLDFFKFKTSFSPTAAELNQARARRTALSFINKIEMEEFSEALEVADEVFRNVRREKDASFAFFNSSYQSFRETVIPKVASDIFLAYAQASLDAARYACVERMLKD